MLTLSRKKRRQDQSISIPLLALARTQAQHGEVRKTEVEAICAMRVNLRCCDRDATDVHHKQHIDLTWSNTGR
jgi:hypothetical protein